MRAAKRCSALIAIGLLAGVLQAGSFAPGRDLPPDVGTNHLGVLWPGAAMEFAGGWVRPHPGPFIWGWIERTPGGYDWTEPDLDVQKLQEQRLAILATIWPFAGWDQATCHGSQPRARGAFGEFGNLLYAPCDMETYLTWLRATVERYDGDGIDDMPGLAYPIRHWEILNEPEMQGPQLRFFQEEPAVYADLLRCSYEAVKIADPEAIVLPAGQSGMHREAVDYWRPILQDESAPFDVGNIHSIRCSDVQQEAAFWAPEYVRLLEENGRGRIGYWITEAQIGSVAKDAGPNDDEDARDLFIGTVTAFCEGADVILHVLANDPKEEKAQLAVGTFNLLGRTIARFVRVERLGAAAIRFDMPDDQAVYALWDGACLPDGIDGAVRVTTYLGAEIVAHASDVTARLPILIVPTL
jgi:hypothetical protein